MAKVPNADGTPPVTVVETPKGPVGEVSVDDGEVVMTAERNPDGTFKTQIDPAQKFDIKVRDKVTGETKVYSKTVPELLRMATDGLAVQKVHDELGYYRKNVDGWKTNAETLTQTKAKLEADLQAQMELNRELLTADEALVVQRREEFAREMSPEKKLARLEAQIAEDANKTKQTTEQTKTAEMVRNFAKTQLAPTLAAAEAKIGPELVKMKLALDLVPFQVNGQVPPERLNALKAHLTGPFMDWVNAKAAERSAPNPAVEAAEKAKRDAEARAQTLANTVGRAMQPVGSAAHAGNDLTKPVAPPKNVNEAIDRIINRPIAATAGR